MKYETKEVIDLVGDYLSNGTKTHHDIDEGEFEQWLSSKEMKCSIFDVEALEKQRNSLIKEGEKVWVRDDVNEEWHQSYFQEFTSKGKAKTLSGMSWEMYSLTNPNK